MNKIKRRKVSQACEQCRLRKTRCDGTKPICSECAGRPNQKTSCRYSFNHAKSQGYDEYVSTLLARINELENQSHTSPASADLPTMMGTETDMGESQIAGNPTQSQIQSEHLQHQAQASLASTSPVDAMGADSNGRHSEEEHQARFYGGSSATALTRQIYQALGNTDDSLHVTSTLPSRNPQDYLHPIGANWTTASLEDFLLLPRQLTDMILDVYWNKIHHLYPFIHKPTFMTAYERLWAGPNHSETSDPVGVTILGSSPYGHDSYIFHCALNSILALGVHLADTPPGDRTKLVGMFAGKARNLCRLDLFDDGSLACIQTLLLMTMCLQSTPYPNRCWNCIGIACRLAQGLGLHIESPKLIAKTPLLELELRRRVWYGCAMLDTIVSATLGRPMMLHKFTPSPPHIPSALDEEQLLLPQPQTQRQPSWMSFYIESIHLYSILADIIANIYGRTNLHPTSAEKEVGIEEISRLDVALSKLENELPQHLQYPSQSISADQPFTSTMFRQQNSVMQARILHLRLLLYRPTFLRFWHQQFGKERCAGSQRPQRNSIAKVTLALDQSISSICLESSIKLIELLAHSIRDCSAGAWWYSLLYTRMAGTTVVLAMCCDSMVGIADKQKTDAAYRTCLTVLEGLRPYSPSVTQAMDQLQRMYHYLLKAKQNQNHGQLAPDNGDASSPSSPEYAFNQANNTDGATCELPDNPILSEFAIFEELFGSNSESWSLESLGLMPNEGF